jgi:hypothetical protein
MDTSDLTVFDQIKISRVAAKCSTLRARLEAHSFKVIKFRVSISPDDIELLSILPDYIGGILTDITTDRTLPAGTINVSALVQ